MQELDTKLGNVINFKGNGDLEITEKQYKTLKGFVYSYRININFGNEEINTRQGASIKIAEIYKAIKSGKVQKRSNLPKNCKVMKINNILKLVQVGDLNDKEHEDSGFASFVSNECYIGINEELLELQAQNMMMEDLIKERIEEDYWREQAQQGQ